MLILSETEAEKMQYAIELYFYKDTEQKLFRLAELVAEYGISTKFPEWKTRPHLTLACFNDVDEHPCAEKLKNFARLCSVLPAYLGLLPTAGSLTALSPSQAEITPKPFIKHPISYFVSSRRSRAGSNP